MKKDDIAKLVAQKIKKGDVKIRSKFSVLAEKLGVGSALLFAILLAIIAIDLLLYWLDVTNNLASLSFGNNGILAFLESFPYIPLIASIVLIILAEILLKRFDISYRAPLLVGIGLLIAIPLVGGVVMKHSGVNEAIERRVEEGHMPPLKPFFGNKPVVRDHAIVGIIKNSTSENIGVDVEGSDINIIISDKTHIPPRATFIVGQWIRAIGKLNGSIFYADVIENLSSHRDERLNFNQLPNVMNN